MSSEEDEILFEPDADFEWALMEEQDTKPEDPENESH